MHILGASPAYRIQRNTQTIKGPKHKESKMMILLWPFDDIWLFVGGSQIVRLFKYLSFSSTNLDFIGIFWELPRHFDKSFVFEIPQRLNDLNHAYISPTNLKRFCQPQTDKSCPISMNIHMLCRYAGGIFFFVPLLWSSWKWSTK